MDGKHRDLLCMKKLKSFAQINRIGFSRVDFVYTHSTSQGKNKELMKERGYLS